jgi:NADH-quinone oxidoreductase subunit I
MRILGSLFSGFATLCTGMAVTFRHMFRRPVTQEYPHVEPKLSSAFRSAIQLVRFDATGTHDCIACMQCVNICPSFCIAIDGTRHEGVKGKRASEFKVDYALCSVCGLCIDVCPTQTLEYSRIYDVAGYRRDEFTYDLLETFRDAEARYIAGLQATASETAAKKAAEAPAAGALPEGQGA